MLYLGPHGSSSDLPVRGSPAPLPPSFESIDALELSRRAFVRSEIPVRPEKVRGADVCLRALISAGVDRLFMLPGGHNLGLYRALEGIGEISVQSARSEQGLAYMADGFARAGGRPAVVVTTAGPGVTNALTALAAAHCESSPILLIALENFRSTLGFESGSFHELDTGQGLFSGLSVCARRALQARDLPYLIESSLSYMATHRPRPAVLLVPADVLSEELPAEARAPLRIERASGLSAERLEAVRTLVGESRRPVLLAGSGALGASQELNQIAAAIGAPIVTTVMGRGAAPDRAPQALGCVWDRVQPLDALAQESDLVLAVGTSLSRLATREGRLPLPGRLIHVDLDPLVFGRFYQPSLAVLGDSQTFLAQLAATGVRSSADAGWLSRARSLAGERERVFAATVPEVSEFISEFRAACPENTRFVLDMTIPAYWMQRYLAVHGPRQMVSSYYYGNLGAGLPCALGVQRAAPGDPVVCVLGDGGALFHPHEMATAISDSLPVVAVVFNDNAFSAVTSDYRRMFKQTSDRFGLANPDFASLAMAFGWDASRVEPSTLGPTLSQALKARRPALIEVRMEKPFPTPFEVAWR